LHLSLEFDKVTFKLYTWEAAWGGGNLLSATPPRSNPSACYLSPPSQSYTDWRIKKYHTV